MQEAPADQLDRSVGWVRDIEQGRRPCPIYALYAMRYLCKHVASENTADLGVDVPAEPTPRETAKPTTAREHEARRVVSSL